MAIITGGDLGPPSLIFYMLAYTFMNLGALCSGNRTWKKGRRERYIEDYSGLGYKHPVLAVAMCIFMFSLAGIPPFVGFIGKFISSAPLLKWLYYSGYHWCGKLRNSSFLLLKSNCRNVHEEASTRICTAFTLAIHNPCPYINVMGHNTSGHISRKNYSTCSEFLTFVLNISQYFQAYQQTFHGKVCKHVIHITHFFY
jgi:hypothetical protein